MSTMKLHRPRGYFQLKTAGPDVATVTLSSANLNGAAVGEYLIKAFDTQSGDPNTSGVIPSGSTLNFSLWMKKSASSGTMVPRAKLYLNSASGTLLCIATGTTALTTTATKYALSCTTSANITLAASDRFYLWVGTNVTTKATATVTAQLSIEGTLNGNYDSQIVVPLPTATPSLTSLSSTSGPIGTSITITGNNFRSTQGSSTVTFNGVASTPTSWSNTSIAVPVPTGATTGSVVVTVGGQASNGIPFTVTPKINTLSPSSGAIGASITISGTSFGATQGTSTVAFNGITTTPTSWSDTSIVAPVPVGAATGPVVVTVAGNASNGVAFTVIPQISSLSPNSGPIGTSVTISGTNFGATQGTSTITFNGTAATPSSWAATTIVAPVPAGATTGPVVVTVGGQASAGVTFTIIPHINTLSPVSGPVGTSVTIAGSGFGATQGTSTVQFNGTTATPSSWSTTSIAVPVPTGATSGPVVITVGGNVSNGVTFTVSPQISSLSPTFGPIGTVVTITGTSFGATQGGSTVTFNGTAARPSSWSATSIVVPVPPGATTGNVVVTVGGLASNGVSFTEGDIYHLHTEASSTTGLKHLKQAGPDVAATSVSVAMTSKSGEQLIQAFDTQLNDPNVAGTIPTGSTLSFTLWMRKSATAGTMTPRAKLYLNSATGTLLCTASTTTTLAVSTTTPTKYVLTCTTAAAVTLAKTDRLYLWVGVNISTSTTSTVNAVVHLEGTLNGNYDSYVLVPLPPSLKITSLSPASGAVGTSVTISGTLFGATQGTSTVTFNGVIAAPTSWSDTSITVPVPPAATSGSVVVTVGGNTSNGVPFSVIPQISTLSPNSGPTGASVTINGTGFGETQGTSTVTFNGTAATPSSWSATSIVAPVPVGASTGPVVVTVGGQASSGITFTVIPTINTLSPTAAPVGTSVTITGSGFGATQGTSTVQFNGTTATPSSWSTTSIAVPVPTGATSGPVVVTVGGNAGNGVTFTVLPQISTLSPNFGPIGTVVTITGTSFGATQGSSSVTFNGTAAIPSSWSATSIVVPVPPGATTGNVVVTVGGLASNGVSFTEGDIYHLHSEASSTSGLMQLKQAGPDMAATSVSVAMTSKSGEQLIKAFDTQLNDPNVAGTIPAGSTLSFTLWMRKDVTAGTMTPLAKLYLNSATGPLLCNAATTTTLAVSTTTPTKYVLTCTTTANVTLAKTDRLYLWVGVNISASTTTAVNAIVHLEGVLNGNYDSYVLVPLPPSLKITSLSPASGAYGTPITISGTLFGATQGSSTVTFNGITAAPTSWSDTSITVPVPTPGPGSTLGTTVPVIVTVNGSASNAVNFTVAPKITNFSPTSGSVGDYFNLDGMAFGQTQGSSTVTLNGILASIGYWSDTLITAYVPTNGTSGPVILTVNGVATNVGNFTVIPTINSSITTKAAPLGSAVSIYGSGFGAAQGTSTVTFNGVPATPTNWTAGRIDTTVPAAATTGPLVVTIGGQTVSILFTVTPPPPTVSSTSPTFGPVGTDVTIIGTNFGTSPGTVPNALVKSWTDTRIIATIYHVPTFNQFDMTVTRPDGQFTSAGTFTIGDIYHLHAEASSTAGAMQLKQGGPDAVSTNVSAVVTNAAGGTMAIKAFDTQLGDPSRNGTIPGRWPTTYSKFVASFWMRKSANNGTMYPYVWLYLNNLTGTPICQAAAGSPVAFNASTPQLYQIECDPSNNITISQTDRLYMVAGLNVTAAPTSSVTAYLYLEGALNGNYDSYVIAPLPTFEVDGYSPTLASPDEPIIIVGTMFGATQGISTVAFNGVTATPTSWSDTSITVPVPASATTGPVTVTVGGVTRTGPTFTVLPKGTITGTVTDSSTGLPISGVNVTIWNAYYTTTTVTDGNGRYSAPKSPAHLAGIPLWVSKSIFRIRRTTLCSVAAVFKVLTPRCPLDKL